MQLALTRHAQARMQQRAIRADAIERLLEFGREAFDHRGGVVLYFDKAARCRLARAAPGEKEWSVSRAATRSSRSGAR